jgi:geranylgeranyl diphosphate synthase type II
MNFEDAPIITMEDYLKMIGLKTAVLIACSAKIGALIGGADAASAQALYDFGYQLGIAFQITDDYLDVYADPNVFGKNIGGDITNNKKSWLLVKTMKDAKGEDKEELNSILALTVEHAEEKIDRMKKLYDKLNIVGAAEAEIEKYYSAAIASLDKVALDHEKREMMLEFAHQIVKRNK